MKKATGILNQVMKHAIRLTLAMTSLMLMLFVLCQTTHGQEEVRDKSLKSYKLPPNLKKYFQDKYKDQMDMNRLTSNLQATPHGPRGTLHIGGHFKVKNVEAISGDKADRGRANAKAFLSDEAELLGLPDLNELHEDKISTSMGHDGEYTSIYYTRYIDGLPLENSRVHVGIGPDESIVLMNISLVPAPSELYQAVAKKRLTKEEVSKLVENDMKAQGKTKELTIKSAHESAISTPPYVIWTITIKQQESGNINQPKDEWGYRIDAVTGKVVSKGKVRRVIVD